ncbi:MAG: hypothetical protein GVY23_03865 [Spirochaetes bacterium]|jgi:hypothetical protein|nr:hypothetical protein [Spirochaetota bacterium]
MVALAIGVLALAGCTTPSATAQGADAGGEAEAAGTSVNPASGGPYPGDLTLPERNDPWPGPETFRIGNAVSAINYWMTAWMLNDVFKMAGFEAEIGDTDQSKLWVPVIEGQWRMEDRDLVRTDELGWATSMELSNGRRAERLATVVMGGAELPGQFPAGRYTVTWDGAGRLSADGVRRAEEGENELVYEYDGSSTVILYIEETDPRGTGDYVRNISMLRPDAVAGETFNPVYLDYLKPFSVIRPLHFLGDQLTYGPPIAWEDRKPHGYSHWGGAMGAPYEVAVDLANESVSDLWLNIPIGADDHYVRELAELTLERLDSNRRLYLELGNELWNFAFPYQMGRDRALEYARRRWPGVLGTVRPYSDGDPVHENMMIYSWQGVRTLEVGAIFREVWGDEADRLVTVLAGQIGGSHPYWAPSRDLLGCPVAVAEEGVEPCGFGVDAFAVAPYVGEAEGEIEFDRSAPEAFLGEAVSYVRGRGEWGAEAAEPGLRYAVRNDRALAEEYDLPLVAYEGGHHFVGSSYTRDVIAVHPMMRELYDALFSVWQEEGGGLFVHLHGVIPRGQNEPGTEPGYFESENFGIKELQTQTRVEAPKWDAVLRRMEMIGQLR